jgi:GNAT superfamily N-acetyltransferase
VIDDEALLRAYDEQMRGFANAGRPGITVERDGPVLRVAGPHRGFVAGPRDLGVTGADLDALITRQRDFFADRGQAVEWKTRGHDLPADIEARLRAAGFGLGEDWSWLADDLVTRIASAPADTVVFAVRDEATGQVVSAAWLVCYPGTDFAGLWGGSTLAAWRRRGIYRALVAIRAQRAAVRGVRYLEVDASNNSAPILRQLGFRAVTTTTPYVWTPPA